MNDFKNTPKRTQTENKARRVSHFKDEADGYGLLIPDIDLDLNSATNSVENWDGGKHYMIIVL